MNIKRFIKWWIIFIIAGFLAIKGTGYTNVENAFFVFLLSGLIIETTSKIAQKFIYSNNTFSVDKKYLMWIIFHSVIFSISTLVLDMIGIGSGFMYYVFMGLAITILTYIIWSFKIRRRRYNTAIVISLIILFIIPYLFFGATPSQTGEQDSTLGSSIDNFINKITGGIKNIGGSGCPQIAVPFHDANGLLAIQPQVYDGWTIAGYTPIPMMVEPIIFCHKGNREGENPSYTYCGGTDDDAYMRKTETNSDGTIGKTIRKTFLNIYDENGMFIKTECGGDPTKIFS